MGPEDSLTSESSDDVTSRLSVSNDAMIPDRDQIELADAVLARLNPTDSHELRQMTTRFGLVSGMLMMIVVFYCSVVLWPIVLKLQGDL